MDASASVLVLLPDMPDPRLPLPAAGLTTLPLSVVVGADRWEQALARVESSEDSAILLLDERTVLLNSVSLDDLVMDGRPVAYVTEDREYWADPPPAAADRRGSQLEVRRIVGVADGSPCLDPRGPLVLSPSIIRSLRAGVLEPRGWTWGDMLAVSPNVASWYSAWLTVTGFADVTPREPAFRTCLTPGERTSLVVRGIEAEDIARSYLGYAGVLPARSQRWLGSTVPFGRLLRAVLLRPYLRMPRLRRLMGWR